MNRSIVSVLLTTSLIVVISRTGVNGDPGCVSPTILTDPADATRCPGAEAIFTVEAGGTAPWSFQWRKDGVPIEDATNSSLNLPWVVPADEGAYDVVVANACGSLASAAALLTVEDTEPPTIACVPDKTVQCNTPWNFDPPVATDECVFNSLVFDNSVHDLLVRFNTEELEVGDEIILEGVARNVTEFIFEYWGLNTEQAQFAGQVQGRVRFYANDGAEFSGYPGPGTLLYDSGNFSVATTPRSTLIIQDFESDAVVPLAGEVPDRFTWTVQFTGLGENDQVGLDLYSPIVVGDGYPDYWERAESGWMLKTNDITSMDFAARIDASYGRVTLAVESTETTTAPDGTLTATRAWSATDSSGNASECEQTVTVYAPTRAWLTLPVGQSLLLPPVADQIADPIGVVVAGDFVRSFIRADVSNLPTGYSIGNQTYQAWDINYWGWIDAGVNYTAVAYDTTEPLPPSLQDDHWDMINYLLNHKQGTWDDIQGAIWHFIGGPVDPGDTHFYPPSQATLNLIDEAVAWGESYRPGPGELCAVLLDYTNPNVARSILEVRRPLEVTRCEAEALSLCASSAGSGTMTYQWYKAGTLLADETGACLEIPSLTLADAGEYRVEVNGACGSATNRLILQVLPNVTATPLTDLVRVVGEAATFATEVTSSGPVTYLWRFGGQEIVGQSGNTLALDAVTADDVGAYTVEISGGCESITNSATLTLTSQPQLAMPVKLPNGTLQITVNGGQGRNCTILASENLTDWTQVATLPNSEGSITWTDPEAALYPNRFYRILLEP